VLTRITSLPPILANQIAAGEVVERPASIIKEVLENAIDANAKSINVELESGGLRLIRIRDDGDGIVKDDLPLALCRHATSKLKHVDDLLAIHTLGFRGEALASISSVSRLTLTSKPQSQDTAWQVQVEGTEQTATVLPAAHPDGTTVEVHDLFFNTPARRKFLRSEKTEYVHCDEVVKRIALSQFDVAFKFKHNQKQIYHLPAAKTESEQSQRIKKICGQNFSQQARVVKANAGHLSLSGWLAPPELSRSQTDLQYFFVNGRIIRDRLINHAIRQAYADYLPVGRHPCFVLYLTFPADQIDVNVHPTKHEVRFRDSRMIHDFITSTLTKTLRTNSEQEINFAPIQLNTTRISQPISSTRSYQPISRPSSYQIKEKLSAYTKLYSPKTIPNPTSANGATPKTPTPTIGHLLGSLHQDYLLLEVPEGLAIIHIQQAQQYMLASKLVLQFEKGLETKPLLMPTTINLNSEQSEQVKQNPDTLKKLGFDAQQKSPDNITIKKVATIFGQSDLETIFFAVLEALDNQPNELNWWLTLLAQLGEQAPFFPTNLDHIQQQTLLQQIEGMNQPLEKLGFYHLISTEYLANLTSAKANQPIESVC